MEVYGRIPEYIKAICCDVDFTVHNNKKFIKERNKREIEWIAKRVGKSVEEIEKTIEEERKKAPQTRVPISEIVIQLFKIPQEEWNEIRNLLVDPQDYLFYDPELAEKIKTLLEDEIVFIFHSNNPEKLTLRMLNIIIGDIAKSVEIVGQSEGLFKPKCEFFEKLVFRRLKKYKVLPQEAVSIGDRLEDDVHAALKAGMNCAFRVDGPKDLIKTLEFIKVVKDPMINIPKFIKTFYLASNKERIIIGVFGQAGAGKTSIAKHTCEELGEEATLIDFDWCFKDSSEERQQKIDKEVMQNPKKWEARNQEGWWDGEKAANLLKDIKEGKIVYLKNVYNREDRGRLTKNITVKPSKINIVEGVGITLYNLKKYYDLLIYIHANDHVREQRLYGRDFERRGKKGRQRWVITQFFEIHYLLPEIEAAHCILDNTEQREKISIVLPKISITKVKESFKKQEEKLKTIFKEEFPLTDYPPI